MKKHNEYDVLLNKINEISIQVEKNKDENNQIISELICKINNMHEEITPYLKKTDICYDLIKGIQDDLCNISDKVTDCKNNTAKIIDISDKNELVNNQDENTNKFLKCSSLIEYIDCLLECMENKLIVFAVKDTCGLGFNVEMAEYMHKLGIKTNLNGKHNYGYIGIIKRGEIVFDCLSGYNGTIQYKGDIEGIYLDVKSSTYNAENIAKISVSGWGNCAVNSRGMNIAVFDLDKRIMIDSACIDTHLNINKIIRKDYFVDEKIVGVGTKLNQTKELLEEIKESIELYNTKEQLLLWGILRKGTDDLSARKEFFLNIPHATGILEKIQKANIILLKEFDRVCRENDIEYWLSFGALLGAVRHKGFIPWDDDIDVCMTRDNLAKLEKAFENNHMVRYITFLSASNTNFCYKIHYNQNEAPYDLDIFVYDYCEEINDEIIEEQDKLKSEIISLIKNNNSNASEIINNYVSKSKDVLKITDKESAKGIIWGVDNFIYGPAKRSSVGLTEIFPLTEIDLYGNKFFVPKEYENYLNKLYGDIYTIPNDIISHTHFSKDKINVKVLDEIIKENSIEEV